MGFMSALTLIMITLKLTELITFSWWLVLLPLYPAALIWTIMIFYIVFLGASVKTTKKRPF